MTQCRLLSIFLTELLEREQNKNGEKANIKQTNKQNNPKQNNTTKLS